MAILTYELRAVGVADVARAFKSVERHMATHMQRVNAMVSMGGGRARLRAASPTQIAGETMRAQKPVFRMFNDEQRKIYESTKRYTVASHREKLKAVEREKKAEISKLRDVARTAKRERESSSGMYRRAIGTGVTGGAGRLAAVGKTGAAMIGVGGSVLAGAAVTEQLRLDEQVRRLSIAGRGAGQKGRDPEELRRQMTTTGMATGIGPEQLAGAAAKYVAKTGDLDTAMTNLKNFAVVAQATGSSVEDVASTAADLAQKFDIKSAQDMGDALAVLAFQGKKGAFELKDMAEQFPEMAAAAQRAGLSGVGGMRTLGGLAQIARQSTGSGAEASTALQMMMTQLTNKSGELHSGSALGGRTVDVFEGGDATKGARDLPTVLAEVISRSNGNQEQLSKLFDVRGIRAVSPMIKTYRDASEAAGGGKKGEAAGKAAVLAMIKDASEASGKFADVQADAADAMKADSIQIDLAMMELKNAVATELMPAVRDLIPHMKQIGPYARRAAEGVISLASAFLENPFLGVGAIMAASITSEIAKAQLSQVISGGLVTPLGALGLAAGALGLSFLAAKAYVDSIWAKAEGKVNEAAGRSNELLDKADAEMAATGKVSPETRAQIDQLSATQRATLAGADAVGKEGYGDLAGRAYQQFVGGGKHNLDESATLGDAGRNEKYTDSVIRTRRLQTADDVAKGMSAGDAKAIFGPAAEALKGAADSLKGVSLNRGNSPSPVKG